MKFNVRILEKMGQTMSIHQMDSVDQMFESFNVKQHAFSQLKTNNKDLVCLLLPDDEDDSEE